MTGAWDHGGRTRQQRGYGAAWDKLRKRILERDHYLCQPCLRGAPSRITLAREVDHVLPKAKGGTDDPANLVAICTPCHRAKSAEDRGVALKSRWTIAPDGWPAE
jgi:5-methylcytosine-specific restriction protein A